MIYFAQTATGSIKIGTTEDLPSRLERLKDHYGAELALLATMPGDRDREAEIHDQFAHLRFGRTEQFRPGPDLMEFIGKPLLVGINPDMVEAAAATGVELKAVRLELPMADYQRLERHAKKLGLNRASFARMAVLRMLEQADEEEKRKGGGR